MLSGLGLFFMGLSVTSIGLNGALITYFVKKKNHPVCTSSCTDTTIRCCNNSKSGNNVYDPSNNPDSNYRETNEEHEQATAGQEIEGTSENSS